MDTMNDFIAGLSSKNPVPGGGGASALIGAISAALCSMVANLTSGKKKYAQYQDDIDRILIRMQEKTATCMKLIDEDAKAFYPLSQAYGIPKDDPERDAILEAALYDACAVPFNILCEVNEITATLEELLIKGSRLAISDVGVAATACRAAAEGAAMNVFINTKLMRDREYAGRINVDTRRLLDECQRHCIYVYNEVTAQLYN